MDYTTIGTLNPHLFAKIHEINPDLKIFAVVTPELLDSAYMLKCFPPNGTHCLTR